MKARVFVSLKSTVLDPQGQAVFPEPPVAVSAQTHAPAAAAEEEESMEFDLEDLDTPAFMRQGRLLN